ncbi:hypothetical protein SAMN05421663_11014 [Terribacillus halophilus]|uniref:Uncharacterized protein n=1 Tax=Terribacillus halophilus TaxID=361279 RepID=A0A1G6UCN2_9BACI|nr:hypothetical protein [Terribacillus halophilus]SDD38347.1 hypothetical protein SAMN05421663_11014 [Terribacillus halophilus]
MVEMMLDFMLGSLRGVSAFYFEHQLIFNGIIIGVVLWRLFTGKKSKQT